MNRFRYLMVTVQFTERMYLYNPEVNAVLRALHHLSQATIEGPSTTRGGWIEAQFTFRKDSPDMNTILSLITLWGILMVPHEQRTKSMTERGRAIIRGELNP